MDRGGLLRSSYRREDEKERRQAHQSTDQCIRDGNIVCEGDYPALENRADRNRDPY